MMEESKEMLSPEEIKKKAYLMGLRLKSSGLDAETIYARLEKQGIPEELAKQVANDVMKERKKEVMENEAKPALNAALIRIGIGVIAALVSVLIFPDKIIIPIGLIGGGVIAALLAKKKIDG